jgi:hypothetical protein
MNTRHLQFVRPSGQPVDSIDMAQLLRDLGEASADNNAVDLFALCLRAQRVLAQVAACGAPLPVEAQVLGYFRGMRDDCQPDALSMMQSLADAYPRQRPTLTLVRPDLDSLGGSR